MMRRDREVINFTQSPVKNNTEFTNFMKMLRIEGYNGKYGSNLQGNKEIIDVIFEIDQIGRNPHNQKSLKMILNSWRN